MTTTSAAVPQLTPERLRIEIYNALVHCIVSNSALWATVDVAEVKATMADAIAACPEGPLCLEPLWSYMRAKGTPYDDASQSIFLFHSRAPRFGITMVLPPELDEVPEAERAAAVEAVRSRGGTTGTFVGRPPQRPAAAAPAAAAAAAPAPSSKKKQPAGRARTIATMAARVVLAAAAITFFFEKAFVADASASKVEAALGGFCDRVVVNGHAALCTATTHARENRSVAHDRAEMIGVALGVEVLFVDDAGEVLDFAH